MPVGSNTEGVPVTFGMAEKTLISDNNLVKFGFRFGELFIGGSYTCYGDLWDLNVRTVQ